MDHICKETSENVRRGQISWSWRGAGHSGKCLQFDGADHSYFMDAFKPVVFRARTFV